MDASPTFATALRFWLKLGFISFGGPAGQIAIMQAELVERKRWIDQERFLHALNFCMLLPGPEAQQLAIYCGWLLHGTWGGVVAGGLFVLPAAVLLWGLSWLYVTLGQVPVVAGFFYGLQAAVLAIVLGAVLRVGRKALRSRVQVAVAAGAFLLLAVGAVPFPFIVLGAATLGWWLAWAGGAQREGRERSGPTITARPGAGEQPETRDESTKWPEALSFPSADTPVGRAAAAAAQAGPVVGAGSAVRVLALWGGLWLLPLLAVQAWPGAPPVLAELGWFFSQAAVVTFGGAYAVLPYVAQAAVGHYGWLQPADMVAGLALAETTPGPLIMVLQFVGFVGAWQHPGDWSPLWAATCGAAITTWVTFAPCFLWIFLGAPYVERLRGVWQLTAALGAVTAAVVGVILQLAVWFGYHVLWPQGVGSGMDGIAAVLALGALLALQVGRVNLLWVILGCGLAGALGQVGRV